MAGKNRKIKRVIHNSWLSDYQKFQHFFIKKFRDYLNCYQYSAVNLRSDWGTY